MPAPEGSASAEHAAIAVGCYPAPSSRRFDDLPALGVSTNYCQLARAANTALRLLNQPAVTGPIPALVTRTMKVSAPAWARPVTLQQPSVGKMIRLAQKPGVPLAGGAATRNGEPD